MKNTVSKLLIDANIAALNARIEDHKLDSAETSARVKALFLKPYPVDYDELLEILNDSEATLPTISYMLSICPFTADEARYVAKQMQTLALNVLIFNFGEASASEEIIDALMNI